VGQFGFSFVPRWDCAIVRHGQKDQKAGEAQTSKGKARLFTNRAFGRSASDQIKAA
jgi:hypothetical protein